MCYEEHLAAQHRHGAYLSPPITPPLSSDESETVGTSRRNGLLSTAGLKASANGLDTSQAKVSPYGRGREVAALSSSSEIGLLDHGSETCALPQIQHVQGNTVLVDY